MIITREKGTLTFEAGPSTQGFPPLPGYHFGRNLLH